MTTPSSSTNASPAVPGAAHAMTTTRGAPGSAPAVPGARLGAASLPVSVPSTGPQVLPARRETPGWRHHLIGRLAIYLALMAMGLTFLMPFWWMVATSLKPKAALFHIPVLWVPLQDPSVWPRLVWENYPRAIGFIPFGLYLQNTLVIALLSTLGVLVSCPLVGYSLAVIPWPGRNVLFALTLATLFLPYQVTLIPLFLVYRQLGWVGTPLPLIAPHWLGGAFYIFLLRQFFRTIPLDLTDAARIDGAGEFRIYWNIMLPLARPVLATVVIFQFLASWRDFLGPLIFLSRKETYTLSLGLQQFRSEFDVEWAMLMAASVIITAPVIIVFFLAQRQFIRGITFSGIKG